MNAKNILAIDVGGTKIAGAIVKFSKNRYRIYDYRKIKTPQNKKEFIEVIEEIIKSRLEKYKIKKIGIAIPGQVNSKKGEIIFTPALVYLKRYQIRKILENKFKLPVKIGRDMNCCALAENRFGVGGKFHNILVVTLSTGVGAGIIINNRVYCGENGSAGEIGHLTLVPNGIKCSCGNKGCLEKYASGRALEREYFKLTGIKKTPPEIEEEFKLNKKNNPARKTVEQASKMLGIGLTSVVNILNPGVIIVIGGISRMDGILDKAQKEIEKNAFIPARKTKIIRSKLGDKGVLIGVAMMEDNDF